MNSSVYKISLDIHSPESQVLLDMKRFDTGRQLQISLTENGWIYPITPDCSAVFTAEKADGNKIYNECLLSGNVIVYDVTQQTTACVGEVACEIRLFNGEGALITSPRFTIVVNKRVYNGEDIIESMPEADALQTLVNDAKKLYGEISENTKKAHTHDNKTVLDSITQEMLDKIGKGLTEEQEADLAANTAARHTHLNKNLLDKLGETDNGKLIFNGEEISAGGIQSVTAFPDNPKEGDVVLLHRCNEITPDDSNSGVILDIPAIVSLGVPEGYYRRQWDVTATTPKGVGLEIAIEIQPVDDYILTGLMVVSETFAGRWYWKNGEFTTDIYGGEAEPPQFTYIPLGYVDGFTFTKTLYDLDYWDTPDTDETVIFRTVPREYMYIGGEWKLTERTDEAEGSIIASVEEKEKDGQLFLRFNLADSRNFKGKKTNKALDIPIAGSKDFSETVGGITTNGTEFEFDKDNEILDTIVNNNGVIEVDGKKLFSTDDGSILRAISASYDEDGTHRVRLMFKPNGICVGIPYLQMYSQTININGEKYMYWFPDLGLHKHENKETLDKLTETEDGKLLFNGAEIGGGDTEEIWTAIDEIRGGIDEIEAMIDESGVLE